MRLITLSLVSGILLLCPNPLFALSQQEKTAILIEEWKQATKPEAERLLEEPPEEESFKKAEIEPLAVTLPEAFDKRITLRASEVSLNTLINKIGQIVEHNVVYDPEVEPGVIVSVDCRDVAIWRALNTILFPLSYGFKLKDGDLVILSEETRTFKLNLPPYTQAFSDTLSNESWTRPDELTAPGSSNPNMNVRVGARVFLESRQEAISFWNDIELNLAKMISPLGRYSFNKLAGLVVVTDNPQALERITKYIELVNSQASQQILAEVKILEVTLSRENAYGIDWNAIYQNLGGIKQIDLVSSLASQNIGPAGIFTLTATGPRADSGSGSSGISALIKALQAQGRVEVISQPKIMLLNNQAAMVQVGSVSSYVSKTTTTTTQAGLATTSATTDQIQEGVSLRLMASISNDEVLVQLTPVVTILDEIRSIDMGSGTIIEAPRTSTRSMHSLVKIKDGETIAVGGLITSNEYKRQKAVPLLHKLPLLGGLFEYKSRALSRTELVIFITPKILRQ